MSLPTASLARYAGSERSLERARRHLPGGVATAMRSGQRPVPLAIERAAGCRLVDVDGNTYIDYVLGFGPLLLGHDPTPVIEAVRRQLGRGLTFGAQHPLEGELAERLVELIPCAERVCFSTTGSEAVHAALRIARASTGRRKVVKFEGHYHGWIDPVHVSIPGSPAGKPDSTGPLPPVPGTGGQVDGSDVLVCRWNDVEHLEAILAHCGEEVAAVLMEPVAANCGVIQPEPEYLANVKTMTERAGALLVFDEVVTGFRLALGGAQERYGVVPDLAVYGKAIAAGIPLSAVAGRREVMSEVAKGRVRHVGTFNCNPPAAAAALAATGVYRDRNPEIYARMESLAGRLASGLEESAAAAGVPLTMHQVGSLLQAFVADPAVPIRSYADTQRADASALALFAEEMLLRGVMVLPRGWWFLSAAHEEGEIEETIEAAQGAFVAVAAAGDNR